MTEIEYMTVDNIDKEWVKRFLQKNKKLSEYDIVWMKEMGSVYIVLLKRKAMKYEYAIVRVSVLFPDEKEKMVLFNVIMLDKNTIEEIWKVVEGL